MSIRDVVLEKNKTKGTLEPKLVYTHGTTVAVDYVGDPSVKGRLGYVWVKENGQNSSIFQCFNPSVRNISNLPVIVSHQIKRPLRRIIIGADWDKMVSTTDNTTYELINHHYTHEWPDMSPGSDAMDVYPRAIVPLKVYPAYPFLAFGVANSRYIYNGTVHRFPGLATQDLTAYLPITTSFYKMILVYLDPVANAVAIVAGTEMANVLPIYPDLPAKGFPLAYIRLAYGQTTLSEADIIEDPRPLFTLGDTSEEIFANINKASAWLEAEFDFVMTRHVVSGG